MYTSTGLYRRRNSTRIPDLVYRGASYFITICTAERACVFGQVDGDDVALSALGNIVREEWRQTAIVRPGVVLDSITIMPNHLHAILFVPAADAPASAKNLGRLVNGFKGAVTRRAGGVVWQRSFYDHVIRTERGYERLRAYIAKNPSRWGRDPLNPDRVRR